mmetsp:Transcript_35256/g.72603  ORF Transcript_35256/g.72603 Transcript_35256/m.72603 type:complete len:206 (+) Transcript_35256:1084-1701(+)
MDQLQRAPRNATRHRPPHLACFGPPFASESWQHPKEQRPPQRHLLPSLSEPASLRAESWPLVLWRRSRMETLWPCSERAAWLASAAQLESCRSFPASASCHPSPWAAAAAVALLSCALLQSSQTLLHEHLLYPLRSQRLLLLLHRIRSQQDSFRPPSHVSVVVPSPSWHFPCACLRDHCPMVRACRWMFPPSPPPQRQLSAFYPP